MKRAALYVRVSTEEQKLNGLSIDNQIDALTEYCKKNEYAIVDVYNDAGHTARKKYKKRSEMLRMLEDCKRHRIDIILFTRLDRWFRSIADYYEVQTILDNCKVPWRAIWEDYETETASGVLKVNIMLSVAQSEADRTSERIKSIMEFKRSKNEYMGKPPVGYKVVNKHLVKDPDKQEGMRKMFDAYLGYRPIREVVEIGRQYGIVKSRNMLSQILGNPVYMGKSRKGITCDPYITEEEYDWIMKRKKHYTRNTKKNHTYLFGGITFCKSCGSIYINRETNKINYLVCHRRKDKFSCQAKIFREDSIEQYLLERIDEIVEKEIQRYKAIISSADNSTEKKKEKLKAKLERVKDLYEEGDISKEEYISKRDNIRQQIGSIPIMSASAPAALPEGWKEIYVELSAEGKSEFWHLIIERITIDSSGEHDIKIRWHESETELITL